MSAAGKVNSKSWVRFPNESYFEKIKHGKSQREILKVLSIKFKDILEKEVPTNNPGLITYDTYWPDLASNPAMLAIPDIVRPRIHKSDPTFGELITFESGA
jgi:hypothetical protein